MTDPNILESRKKAVDKPSGSACNIPPYVLPRPLDKCELWDLEEARKARAREREMIQKE